ncbi:MAG: HAMP domain-containing sensor histidine kinase [Planctomycetota bacterium]
MIRPSGRVAPPEYQEVDVEQVLRAIADQFEPSFAATGISIELNCRVGVAEVDPDIVEMVMVNLLGNVEKYVPVARPQGGLCRVSATLQRGSESREQLSILVEDNGPGIGRRNHSRVFRPFVRLDDSINAPSGTGIGLTIARRAARRHGGDLLLKSDCELGGAAFELTLPLSKKAAKCDKQATTTPE